jgi:hypothetical protein
MRYTIRLRLHNSLGEAFTDITTNEVTAGQLIAAGCDSWKTPGPYESEPSRTYVETYNLAYVQELGRQRDEYRKSVEAAEQAKTILRAEAGQAVELAAKLEAEVLELKAQLDSKKAALAATRGDLAKAQRSTK